jgi:tetratricopeptide (TPR) repeat protein
MLPSPNAHPAGAPKARSVASRTEASAPTLDQARTRILAMFRTRRELIRLSAVSEYVDQAYAGLEEIGGAAETWGAAALIPTTQKALASVAKVSLRADDSNGEIGDLAYELLALHAELCNAEPPKPAALVEWLIDFRFGGTQDFFEPDIAEYTDALGPRGLFLLGQRLDALEAALPPQTKESDSTRELIGRYRERLAVAGGDPEEVIASFGELTRSYRMHDLAEALVEVGDVDEAIAYAERATLLETGRQAERAGQYWCELLHEEYPHEDELAARQLVFDRWPSAKNALALAQAADDENSDVEWSSLAESVYARLETQHPRELITTLLGRGLVDRAWEAAERLTTDAGLWTVLVAAREKTDPASVVPVLIRLIDADLQVAKPQNYKSAVKRLKQLRKALKATDAAARFPLIVAELREQHRRRPTLLEAFDRAGF